MDNGHYSIRQYRTYLLKPNTSSNFDQEKGTGEFSSGRHEVLVLKLPMLCLVALCRPATYGKEVSQW